jgi:hypothetical protein
LPLGYFHTSQSPSTRLARHDAHRLPAISSGLVVLELPLAESADLGRELGPGWGFLGLDSIAQEVPNSISVPAFDHQVVAAYERAFLVYAALQPPGRADNDVERLFTRLSLGTDHHLDQQPDVLRIVGYVAIKIGVGTMEAANYGSHDGSVMSR